ncbi:MAG TPA: hypothetical protein VFZ97_19990 [Acidimicrobiales bacterium]
MNPTTMTMVTYTVKADRVPENEELIAAVYKELHEVRPAGLRYATFRVDRGARFVHMAMVEPGVEPHPLTSQASFQAFSSNIAERCEEPPVAVQLDEVGSYGFFPR